MNVSITSLACFDARRTCGAALDASGGSAHECLDKKKHGHVKCAYWKPCRLSAHTFLSLLKMPRVRKKDKRICFLESWCDASSRCGTWCVCQICTWRWGVVLGWEKSMAMPNLHTKTLSWLCSHFSLFIEDAKNEKQPDKRIFFLAHGFWREGETRSTFWLKDFVC